MERIVQQRIASTEVKIIRELSVPVCFFVRVTIPVHAEPQVISRESVEQRIFTKIPYVGDITVLHIKNCTSIDQAVGVLTLHAD